METSEIALCQAVDAVEKKVSPFLKQISAVDPEAWNAYNPKANILGGMCIVC